MTLVAAPTCAVVLAGGGARGAYEAGVLRYLREAVPAGADFAPGILCGTSVGAIHAAFLAATAHEPATQAAALASFWEELRFDDVFRLGIRELLSVRSRMLGGEEPGGLVDHAPLEKLVRERIDWTALRANVDRGIVAALSISTTEIRTGRTVVFVDRAQGPLPSWTRDLHVVARPARIGPEETLASAAIPLVFPSVRIGQSFYCDGSLRQNTPLSPALRLGADRVLVVGSRRRESSVSDEPRPPPDRAPTPLFLVGKILNALLLDRIDYDLARLEGYNLLLEHVETTFGEGAVERLSDVVRKAGGRPLRRIEYVHVRPSRDIGALAAEYAASPEFRKRTRGLTGRLAQRFARREAWQEADFLSYFLFDGGFARKLLALGYEDARSRHAELVRFIGP